jgi:predicted transcriptional regulator of viral defense system
MTRFSKRTEIPLSSLSRIIKRFIDSGLAIRLNRGEYLINPLAFQSKGSSNELIEKAQNLWNYEKDKIEWQQQD